eukprot:GGOE01053831.1.p1 GENE.GGOE01053831.1~~GGOE01053831.1.p1  ORF type:complete len:526 (-),score=117.27 GGOE01053831.1:198-1721(-)
MSTIGGLDWLAEKKVAPLIDTLLVGLLKDKPVQPIDFLIGQLQLIQGGVNVDELRAMTRKNRSTVAQSVHQFEHQVEEECTQTDFEVEKLAPTSFPSPLAADRVVGDLPGIIYNYFAHNGIISPPLLMSSAGPHAQLHFNPRETIVGIVSCGGLCPGLNDVTRAITLFSLEVYGVKKVIGFKYGWMGLMEEGIGEAFELTSEIVRDVHRTGGSFLGSSRGRPVHKHGEEMVDSLVRLGVNVLFALGGDGTLKGARDLCGFIKKRGVDIGVVGIPKTIDNDVCYVQKTFGFETACNEATVALKAAQAEARSHKYGVGLVKLMGRHSGFVAAQASLAFGAAHVVLIPENVVPLETIFKLIAKRFERKRYCIIVVAEGFGEDLMEVSGTDASGNKKLGDIGLFLKKEIEKWLSQNYDESTCKYIDPSYMIRACPATTNDAAFCAQLGNNAVHEAMHGHTNCLVGYWNNVFTVVPITLCVSKRKFVNTKGDMWRGVREMSISLREHRHRRG